MNRLRAARLLVNRGIDCAESIDILQGVQDFCGGQDAAPFAARLATDAPTLAVIFVGINDVRHGLGPVFAASEQALRDLVELAQASGAAVLLVSPAVSGEHPDGSNPFDPDIDVFAAIGARVADETGATFVHLREVVVAYLGNHNVTVLPGGSQTYQTSGVLTIDEVHPNGAGVELLAEHIANGLARAAAPAVPLLAGMWRMAALAAALMTAFSASGAWPAPRA